MKDMQSNKVLSVKELLEVFVSKIWIIILVSFLSVGLVMVQQRFFFNPEYEAKATMNVLNKAGEDATVLSSEAFKNCSKILKSNEVLEQVIDVLKLDVNYSSLYMEIEVNNPANTRVMEIVVTTDDPQLSMKIADSVFEIGSAKVTKDLKYEITRYKESTFSSKPCNYLGKLNYVLIGFSGAVIAYSYFVVKMLVNGKFNKKY